MLLTGPRGRILAANSAALLMFGRRLDQLRGKRVETVLKPRRPEGSLTLRLAPDPSVFDGAWSVMRSAGRKAGAVILKKTDGGAGHMLWVLRDVSATQSTVHELEQKTRLLVEAERVGRMGGWEFDPATQLIIWTGELQRLMGIREDRMTVERSNAFYVGVSREIVREAFKVTLREGTPYDLELEVLTGDGRRMWIREVCRPTIRRGKLVSVVGVVQDISERRHMADLLAQSVDRERTRIAADLHDGVGQELTGLAFGLSGAAAAYRRECPDAAREFAACSETARQALTRLREMSHSLLPLELRDVGFTGVCRQLAASVRCTLGIRAQFRFRGDKSHVPVDSAAEHLYRIAQEAVANAIKHGAAKRITMTLTADATKLLLTISDDGSGLNATHKSRGVGMQIMRYRARLLGGVLALKAMRQGGTRLRCIVPRSAIDGHRPPL